MARAATAVDAAGFVVAGLCGELAMDSITAEAYVVAGVDPPRASAAAVRSAGARRWSAAGAGRRARRGAGTPVIAGTLDSYADVAGTGAAPGTGCLLLGSTLIAYAVWPEPVAVPGLEVQHQPAPGVLVGGSSVCGGATLDWLGELLGAGAGDLQAHWRRARAGCWCCPTSRASGRPSTTRSRAEPCSASPTRPRATSCVARSSTRSR